MKILLLFLSLTLTYSTSTIQTKAYNTLVVIYQPSVVDVLDPSRPRLA